MRRHLLAGEEVAALIRGGEPLLLAGDERPLRELPRGSWIGGTTPYFLAEGGGTVDRERVFVERLPEGSRCLGVRRYDDRSIARVHADVPRAGMGAMVAPFGSAVHGAFAVNAPTYPAFATAPLFGWIAGVELAELGRTSPLVFDGTTGDALGEEAIVMHASTPPGKTVDVGILNIFSAGEGPEITFPETGFTARSAAVGGRRVVFADYVEESGLDTRLPLVADYCGARVNVSFRGVDPRAGAVRFFAPVFAAVRYRLARPVRDYVEAFASALPPGLTERVAFSCNCVLNYLHSSLEGRSTALLGPATFGEIAYQLLNQTVVYLTVSDAR